MGLLNACTVDLLCMIAIAELFISEEIINHLCILFLFQICL